MRTLAGHQGGVLGAVQLSTRHVASWSYEAPVRVWDLTTGQPVAEWQSGDSPVARQLSDGRLLTRGERDDGPDIRMRIWRATDDEPVTLEPAGDITGVTEIEAGLFGWSDDGTFRLWDLAAGTLIREDTVPEIASSGAISLSEDRVLLYSDDHGSMWIWRARTGTLEHSLEGHDDRVTGALALPDGRFVSWNWDELRVWNHDGACTNAISHHHSGTYDARILTNGRLATWTTSSIGRLCVWDLDDATSTVLADGEGTFRACWQRRDGSLVASAWGRTMAWDLETLAPLGQIPDELVTECTDGRLIGTSSQVRIWAPDAWQAPPEGGAGDSDSDTGALAITAERMVVWNQARIDLWDTIGRHRVIRVKTPAAGVVRLDDRTFASWTTEHVVSVWNATTGAQLASLEGHTDDVRGAAVLSTGHLLSWSADGAIRTWDLDRGECVRILEDEPIRQGPSSPMTSMYGDWRDMVEWHTNEMGQRSDVCGVIEAAASVLVSWSQDYCLRVWDCQSGDRLDSKLVHEWDVRGVARLASGRLISWAGDGLLVIWDLRPNGSLHEVRRWQGYGDSRYGGVKGIRVLEDQRILSWGADELKLSGPELAGKSRVFADPGVAGVAELKDGRLMTWSRERYRLWHLDSGELVTAGPLQEALRQPELATARASVEAPLLVTTRGVAWASEGCAGVTLYGPPARFTEWHSSARAVTPVCFVNRSVVIREEDELVFLDLIGDTSVET